MTHPPFQFQNGLSYECTNCGKCCGDHWALRIDPQTLEDMQQNWKVQTPKMDHPQDFYERRESTTHKGDPQHVFKCKEGKCVFLDEENLCIMHREWGFDRKASNCKQYPFTFTKAPDGIRVGLLFSCEGVALAPTDAPLPEAEANQIFPTARNI